MESIVVIQRSANPYPYTNSSSRRGMVVAFEVIHTKLFKPSPANSTPSTVHSNLPIDSRDQFGVDSPCFSAFELNLIEANVVKTAIFFNKSFRTLNWDRHWYV